ncbi:hypothetical protein FOZ62_002346, partial [Perkinsus olseni]
MLEHSEAAVIDLSVRNSEIFLQHKKDVQSLGEAMWSAKNTPNSYFVDLNDSPNYDFGGDDGDSENEQEPQASDDEGALSAVFLLASRSMWNGPPPAAGPMQMGGGPPPPGYYPPNTQQWPGPPPMPPPQQQPLGGYPLPQGQAWPPQHQQQQWGGGGRMRAWSDEGQSPPRQAFYPPPEHPLGPPQQQQPPPMPWQQQHQHPPSYMPPVNQQFPSQVPPMPYVGGQQQQPPPYSQPLSFTHPPPPAQMPYGGPPPQHGGFMPPPQPPQQQQQPIPPPAPIEEKFSKELQAIADNYHLPDTTANLNPQLAARYGAIIVSLAGGVPASDDSIRDAAAWLLENRQQTSAIAASLLRSMRMPKDGHHAMSMLFVIHEVLPQTSGPQGVVVRVLLKNYLPWMCRAAYGACYNRNSRKPG